MHIQFKNKGALVLPIGIVSMAVVFISYGVIGWLWEIKDSKHVDDVLGGISMLLAGTINYLTTKNYFINRKGEEEDFEEEGTFMLIKVSLWTRIFFALGLLILLAS